MKKEAIVYLVILVLLAGALVITGRPWIGIVLAVMLFYLALAGLIVALEGRRLNLKITAESEAEKGEAAKILLEAENASRMPVAGCHVLLQICNLLTGAKEQEKLRFGIFPKKKKECEISAFDSCCGMLCIRAVKVQLSDPLGLFYKRSKTLPAEAKILIRPELSKTEIARTALEHYDMESFRYADGRVGTDSSETVGIRAYREGDSVRAIHWKLSAKQGEPLVKEYGYPVDTRLMVIADKQIAERSEPADSRKSAASDLFRSMDVLTEYTLSVCLSLTEQEVSHTLGWYDAAEERFVCEDVRTADDIQRLLPEFLSAPFFGQGQTFSEQGQAVFGQSQTFSGQSRAVSGQSRAKSGKNRSEWPGKGISRQEKETGSASYFLESDAEKNYAGYLYITNQETEDAGLSRMKEAGNVTVLVPKTEEERVG